MPEQRVYDADEVDRYVDGLRAYIEELEGQLANLRRDQPNLPDT